MNNKTYFSDVIPYLVDYYNQFETLPTKVVECTKGTGAYTCFGQNLKSKVEKAGGIEKLLRNFIGRGAKKNAVTASIEKRTKKVTSTVPVPEIGIEIETTAEIAA